MQSPVTFELRRQDSIITPDGLIIVSVTLEAIAEPPGYRVRVRAPGVLHRLARFIRSRYRRMFRRTAYLSCQISSRLTTRCPFQAPRKPTRYRSRQP
jgi:hypothetical protein